MVRFLLSIAALSSVLMSATHASATLSAVRRTSVSGDTYVQYAQRLSLFNNPNTQAEEVVWQKGAFKDANWERVPTLSADELQASFELARDEKALVDSQNRARRASWLYPDDGCFMRASIAADMIEQATQIKPAKIFAFGSLEVDTKNSPDGRVTWWYHVAAITKVVEPATPGTPAKETMYVYDPAMDPEKPMEVKAWLQAMHDPHIQIAICSSGAYDPDSNCADGQSGTVDRARGESSTYLDSEWFRVEELGRDPKRELGDFPPWLAKF